MKLPAQLKTESITALVDTREQRAIERKSLPDLVACCGRERDRFDREVQRLLAYPVRALVVEADWSDIDAGQWRSRLTSKHVSGSLASWVVRGLPVVMAGNHERAGKLVASMLTRAAIHRYRELREFARDVEVGS